MHQSLGQLSQWGQIIFNLSAIILSNATVVKTDAEKKVKVTQSQKQISKFSFEPKTKLKHFCNSALASKMDQIKKIMAEYHAN